jgi:L-iditol 2-dehydrogenase
MRVGMYYSNNDVRIEEMPIPSIGDREILVKVLHSGICGSDVMEWYRIKKAPLVLGHEIAGIVEKVGSQVAKFKPGDRVFVSHHVPCNTCHYCLRDAHTDCHTLHTTNFDPGGFSEYIRVPELQVDRGTFIIPDEMPLEMGVFIEPLACVVRGQRKAGLTADETVLILGSGISGLLHIPLAKASKAGLVIATDISQKRLDSAKRFGADYVYNASENIPERIKQHNHGRLADLVIICTAAIPAHEQALECVESSGTILLFGVASPGEIWQFPVFDFWKKGLKMVATYAGAPVDIEQSIELMRTGQVKLQGMITHRLPLTEIQNGFDLVASAEDSIKVIIEPHS